MLVGIIESQDSILVTPLYPFAHEPKHVNVSMWYHRIVLQYYAVGFAWLRVLFALQERGNKLQISD
jgi:hypothetical protein